MQARCVRFDDIARSLCPRYAFTALRARLVGLWCMSCMRMQVVYKLRALPHTLQEIISWKDRLSNRLGLFDLSEKSLGAARIEA